MTVRAKNRAITAAAIFSIGAFVAAVLPMVASTASTDLDQRRDVHLVIRDMAFYLDGKGEPNPTLQFRQGERVRVIVRSEDTGMNHDFVVKNWKVASRLLHGRDEEVVNIKVPREAGSTTYACTPHAEKMRGTILIQ